MTADALDFALETLAIERTGVCDRLMNLYLTLDVFPEVPRVLKQLKEAGLRTAILSNGSPRMLNAAVDGAGIGGLIDAVLSVEEVGVYKPHPKVYQLALDRMSMPALAIAFQSAGPRTIVAFFRSDCGSIHGAGPALMAQESAAPVIWQARRSAHSDSSVILTAVKVDFGSSSSRPTARTRTFRRCKVSLCLSSADGCHHFFQRYPRA